MFFLPGEGDAPAHEIAPPAKSWGDAWRDMASATSDLQRFSENSNNADEAIIEAYRRRNAAIHEATGVQLDNPAYLYGDGWRPHGTNAYSLETVDDQLNARSAEKRAEWLRRTNELKTRFPDRPDLFDDTVEQDALALTRSARADYERASEDPALGTLGWLSALIAGGGLGMLRDPTFVPMVMAGAPAGVGKTVAGRIGRVMLYEAAINAGGEAAMQTLAEPWKNRAGVETSWQEFFVNAGLAGAFGAGLGGGVQAGAEIYRALKIARPARKAAERILTNRPQPGDVESLAAALGREIPGDQKTILARSFEEDALDGFMARPEASPEELMVMEAARRFAEDPDNYPPPEVVERMLADRIALRDGTAADYGRVFDLEETFAEGAPEPPAGRLAPDEAIEPLEDADLARAERLAGRATETPEAAPAPAANRSAVQSAAPDPNAPKIFDYDDNGNVVGRTLDEWLGDADLPARHADLLEACKL